jgi:hypothetical protein
MEGQRVNEKYSRINIYKAHIFDHENGRVICGTDHGWARPNKRLMNANKMFEKHKLISEKRGGPNPFKWCCSKCYSKMLDILKSDKTERLDKEV